MCVNQVCLCAADRTGQYVRQLLEPAFITVPAAVDIPALFQSALHMSGTLPFPVPDVFYESQRLQNGHGVLFGTSLKIRRCNAQLCYTYCSLQAVPCRDRDRASRSTSDLHDCLLACAIHALLCVQGLYAACVLCC